MTIADVIRRALSKLGYEVSAGVQAADLAIGLAGAIWLLTDLIEGGKFGPLKDSQAPADIDAKEGQRIYAEPGVVITLPTTIQDGCERAPRPFSPVVVVQSGAEKVYFFSPTTGTWVRVDNMTASSTFPLADSEGFAAMLAEAIADDFGGIDALAPRVLRQAATARTRLSLRLGSNAPITEAVYF